MTRSWAKTIGAALLAMTAIGAQADWQAFKDDVNAAIDASLTYSRNNGGFTNGNNGTGLVLLTLLEKDNSTGYAGLTAADKGRADSAACTLMTSGNFGARGGFYSYYDGQVMMALSVYRTTGGPENPGACTAHSVTATIDKVVDRTLASQTGGTPAQWSCAGYWGYNGNGCDSSTTQLTLAGLAAAKGFYTTMPDPGSRKTSIQAALDRTSVAYELNGKFQAAVEFTNCGVGCLGHGYQSNYGIGHGYGNPSSQQTASGTWGQLLGTGKSVNDPTVQAYLRWAENAYNYDTNLFQGAGWAQAYFYFLWSSSKAFNIIEKSGVSISAGNIGPTSMGTLPAVAGRMINRVPANDTRPVPRGAGAAGYYTGAQAGWYYDYAYRLMTLQLADGRFNNPNGSWDGWVDHAYATLVLQRSLGGACVDTDGDGVCDTQDNCPAVANPDQANHLAGISPVGDACRVKCDVNGDGKVDMTDINLVKAQIGKALVVNDPRDADSNSAVNLVDVRTCIAKCTKPGCAS